MRYWLCSVVSSAVVCRLTYPLVVEVYRFYNQWCHLSIPPSCCFGSSGTSFFHALNQPWSEVSVSLHEEGSNLFLFVERNPLFPLTCNNIDHVRQQDLSIKRNLWQMIEWVHVCNKTFCMLFCCNNNNEWTIKSRPQTLKQSACCFAATTNQVYVLLKLLHANLL